MIMMAVMTSTMLVIIPSMRHGNTLGHQPCCCCWLCENITTNLIGVVAVDVDAVVAVSAAAGGGGGGVMLPSIL